MIYFGLLDGQITVTGIEDEQGDLTRVEVVNTSGRILHFQVFWRAGQRTFTLDRAAGSGSFAQDVPPAFGKRKGLDCNYGGWAE